MIIDGKKLSDEIGEGLKLYMEKRVMRPKLAVIVAEENSVTERFVQVKLRFAERIGVKLSVIRVRRELRTSESMIEQIFHLTRDYDGIVVQLPLPPSISGENIFRMLPFTHDVDVLGETAYTQYKEGHLPILPPVVAAFAEVLRQNNVLLAGKNVFILGEGRLVGAPALIWARKMGAAQIETANKETGDIAALSSRADVLILGAGAPGIITPDMIAPGAIILDAGTSEAGGRIHGDADPACAEKAAIFTPTPGGIGPLTVAMIFKNLLSLYELRQAGPR